MLTKLNSTPDSAVTSTGALLIKPVVKSFVKGKRPPARDGHSVVVDGHRMIIFGGDRHHMPFNDLYVLDLESEFKQAILNP